MSSETNFGGCGLACFGDFAHFCLPLKQPKFPFRPWPWGSIVHGGQKKNWLKKFMQVEVAVKCMQTNFGGCGLACFGDFAHFFLSSKRPKFPFCPWGSKIELARKFMQVEVVVKCMQISLGGHGLSSIGDFALFLFACKMVKISYRNIHLKKIYIYTLCNVMLQFSSLKCVSHNIELQKVE